MRITPLVLALALTGASTKARADEDDPSKHRLQLILKGDFTTAKTDSITFWRSTAATGVAFDILPALNVYGLLHLGKTSFSYGGNVTEDLKLNGELSSGGDVSIEGGLRVTLLRRGRFSLTTFGEFEASPTATKFDLGRVSIRTEQGDFDITNYGKAHSSFYFTWYRVAVGTGFHVRLGRFIPRLHVGFERLDASIDMHVNDEGKKMLTSLGYDGNRLENRYSVGHNLAIIAPGLEIELPRRFAIDIRGVIAPLRDGMKMTFSFGLTWRP